MRFISRGAFLALVAVFALGVVGSASAAPNYPEFTVKSPTKFPVAFTGTSGSVSFEEPATKGTYTCSSSSVSGQINGPKEIGKVVVKFSGCGGTHPICWNHKPSGLWETKELNGRIAYLSKTGKTVGLLLEPTTQPVATCGFGFAEIGYEEEILGSILGQISPLNQEKTGPFTVGYGSWTRFEGEEAIHNLQKVFEHGKPTELKMNDVLTITMAHAVQISA